MSALFLAAVQSMTTPFVPMQRSWSVAALFEGLGRDSVTCAPAEAPLRDRSSRGLGVGLEHLGANVVLCARHHPKMHSEHLDGKGCAEQKTRDLSEALRAKVRGRP